MKRDYAQEVRDRLNEIGGLPQPSHTVLVERPRTGLGVRRVQVCREVRRVPFKNTTEYVYRLTTYCEVDKRAQETVRPINPNIRSRHDTVLEVSDPDDAHAAYVFAQQMRALHQWLGREPVNADRLTALARYYDTIDA